MQLITLEEIRTAAELLDSVIRHTPIDTSRPLQEMVGGQVYLKCENLQRTGSFKIRGAYNRISKLSDEERARGVVAASAGNHAQGVALAARILGTTATVYMPVGASIAKLAATRAYGATVHLVGETIEGSLTAAREFSDETGAVLVHPFDHPDIIRGQGTVGLEICEQVPDVATVIVAVGGGGLISGIATAVKALKPGVRVVGVQAESAAAWPDSLKAGHPVRANSMMTLADGIAVDQPSDLTYAHVSTLVDEIVTVTEGELSRAMLLCLERAKLVVEPAGAAAIAAILAHPTAFKAPVVAVLSGGNIDPLLLMHVAQHGLVAAGRFLSLRVDVPDRPGSLARMLTLVADRGGNVIDVVHSRVGSGLRLGDVQVSLRLECKGHEHGKEVMAALNAAGLTVHIDE
ncbi:MAG: threonine ammonia-lyase [Nakamurella sp.]